MQTYYTCPDTNVNISINLPVHPDDREKYWFEPLVFACAACGQLHNTDYKDAYRVGVMSEFECLPVDIQEAQLQ